MEENMKIKSIQRVLAAVDFSNASLKSLETAVAICKRQLATLTLIHVVEPNYADTGIAGHGILPDLIETADEHLRGIASDIRVGEDVVINHIVQSGNTVDQIVLWASLHHVDLVVMGTHGLSRWREFFMGSTAFGVIKRSVCPVLTVPGHFQSVDFRKVLFPVRLIPDALEKYDALRPFIRKNKSKLFIAGLLASSNPDNQDEMEGLLHDMKVKLIQDDVVFSSELHICEDIGRQVLALAQLDNPDLIVITSTLDHSWRGLFPGTYVQEIVHHAKFPVLSIPAYSGQH